MEEKVKMDGIYPRNFKIWFLTKLAPQICSRRSRRGSRPCACTWSMDAAAKVGMLAQSKTKFWSSLGIY